MSALTPHLGTQLTAGDSGGGSSPRRRRGLLLAAVALAALGVAAVALALLGGGGADEEPGAAGEVAVDGSALEPFEDPADDAAIGAAAPAVDGADYDGSPVAVEPGEEPVVLLFLAHWCEVCDAELGTVQQLVDRDALPEEVRLVAVSTGQREGAVNHPAQEWLDDAGWTVPTLVDNDAGHVAGAYGLGSYPYWVFIDGDGAVAGRLAGALAGEDLVRLAEELAAR